RESRHNLKYWRDGSWMAFGCGAHGTRNGRRWKNVSATEEYVRRVTGGASPMAEAHDLSEQERLEDMLFTGLRLTEGLQLAEIRAKFGVDVWERYGFGLEPFVRAGVLEHRPATLRLNRKGMLLANEVC